MLADGEGGGFGPVFWRVGRHLVKLEVNMYGDEVSWLNHVNSFSRFYINIYIYRNPDTRLATPIHRASS